MFPDAHYVVLHIGPGRTVLQDVSLTAIGDAGRFDLTPDIWVERLDADLAKLIIRACDPPHHGINAIEHDYHLYAWVRRVPSYESKSFEGLQPMLGAIALSRLIQPTSTGLRYCAYISDLSPDARVVRAIPFKGISHDVILGPGTRDWLTEADGTEVQKLMVWLGRDMHERVRRAYWNHEYALRLYELDMRWPLIVGGFEALINTGRKEVTWQFTDRVSRLAAQFGISLTEDDLDKAYNLRSRLVHGERFLHALDASVPVIDQPVLYQKLETLLRLTVRECLMDGSFHDHFKDGPTVEACWPLRPKPNAKSRCKPKGKP
ncbi:MAG TPA: hypothetical protein VNW54_16615 [Granulicella sp.]|nr:hypothetical protein [Granulicella sp.]